MISQLVHFVIIILPSKKNIVELQFKQITSNLFPQVTQSLSWNGDQPIVDAINAVEWSIEYGVWGIM